MRNIVIPLTALFLNAMAVSAQSVSDITHELSRMEKMLGSDMSKLTDDEKRQLVDDLSSLKDLIALVTPEMQKASNPLELMGFMKQVLKIKNTAEKFKEKNIDL